MKVFDDVAPVIRDNFEMSYLTEDGNKEKFLGNVRVFSDGAAYLRLMRAMSGDGSEMGNELSALLSKVMDDKDGTVDSKWTSKPLDPPSDLDEDELAEWSPHYRGPDGQIYDLADKDTLVKWDDQSVWTTRRRWIQFMDHDDTTYVSVQSLVNIAEWVLGLSAERPTRPRG